MGAMKNFGGNEGPAVKGQGKNIIFPPQHFSFCLLLELASQVF